MPTSYNGWEASKSPTKIGIVPLVVDGVSFPPGCKSGPVHVVMSYLAHRLMTEVEPAGEGCWGYNYRQNRNAANLSCHASGTAIDFNAPKHPNGKRGTFSPAQVAAIERILDDIGVIAWGGHFHGVPDEMHFEIHGTPAEVGAAATLIQARASRPTPSKEWDEMATKEEIQEAAREAVQPLIDAAVAKNHAEHVLILHGDKGHPVSLDSIAKATKVPGAPS
jgi:hypothetical protein